MIFRRIRDWPTTDICSSGCCVFESRRKRRTISKDSEFTIRKTPLSVLDQIRFLLEDCGCEETSYPTNNRLISISHFEHEITFHRKLSCLCSLCFSLANHKTSQWDYRDRWRHLFLFTMSRSNCVVGTGKKRSLSESRGVHIGGGHLQQKSLGRSWDRSV